MRRLRTVVIEGFKTFATPVVVDLAEGLTAVVGPNGCGKSNFIDAIAWAVGSRSWKSLRGAEMEDVIFHGAEGVSSSNRAVVRLVFDNSDRALPLDMEEVEVAREIERKSGSRSFINRVEARVKDLHSLLSGTGLVGGFSLVRQGAVDQLILSTPEEIGRWIEEAANIASFRAKRKEVLERMEKVRTNLAQSEAHVDQLRKDYRKVKDRASKAKERHVLEEKASLLRNQVAWLERSAIEEELAVLEAKRGTLPEEELDLSRRRTELLETRSLLEAELAREESQAQTPAEISPAAAADKAGRLLTTAAFIADQSKVLDREGPSSWKLVNGNLSRAVDMIRAIQTNSPAETKPSVKAEKTAGQRLREVLRNLDALDARRGTISRELALLDQDHARLEERLNHVPSLTVPPEPLPEVGLDALRDDLSRIERDLAKIGPVDQTAASQEEELLAKISAAKAALKDLREAQGTLLRFLDELDALTIQVFKSTLRKVEKRFQQHFETLFGGGAVRLSLKSLGEEPDLRDEVQAPPISIDVKMPGKGESAHTLLSGGERSLTGIALILALAAGDEEEGKGGRLLIMDEVDAALDQANAVRFARLVANLSKTHQVLCVTHNNLTAREAARLIGVTAGNTGGTSVVLEVSLQQAQAAAATA